MEIPASVWAAAVALMGSIAVYFGALSRRLKRLASTAELPEGERRQHIRREEWNALVSKVDALVRATDEDRWRLEQLVEERQELGAMMQKVAADVVAIRVHLARLEVKAGLDTPPEGTRIG